MKPLKTLKAKKLSIKKETLRQLTDKDLERANGGYVAGNTGSAWCSSNGYYTGPGKCGTYVLSR
ncbi:MAG TPA: hypothetical protein VF945_07145 [Polyangia bacterium]